MSVDPDVLAVARAMDAEERRASVDCMTIRNRARRQADDILEAAERACRERMAAYFAAVDALGKQCAAPARPPAEGEP